MANMKSDRRAGMYYNNDRGYISVTKVLTVIDKGYALQRWYGKEVYMAVAANPSISEKDALYAPYMASRKAADRGTTVHSLIEAFKQTGTVVNTVPEQFKGYANGFYRWVEDHKPIILESEKSVFNNKYGYAGTLDMIANIGGKRYVIDFKTNKDGNVYTEAHMQVSAYINADDMIGIDGGVIVSLAEDGTYTHQIAKNGFRAFINALELYAFINYGDLMKLKWKQGV
jgi:hypothetical protein